MRDKDGLDGSPDMSMTAFGAVGWTAFFGVGDFGLMELGLGDLSSFGSGLFPLPGDGEPSRGEPLEDASFLAGMSDALVKKSPGRLSGGRGETGQARPMTAFFAVGDFGLADLSPLRSRLFPLLEDGDTSREKRPACGRPACSAPDAFAASPSCELLQLLTTSWPYVSLFAAALTPLKI